MMVVLSDHLDASANDRRACRQRALERLIEAVIDDAAERARCRDTDVVAATRVRGW